MAPSPKFLTLLSLLLLVLGAACGFMLHSGWLSLELFGKSIDLYNPLAHRFATQRIDSVKLDFEQYLQQKQEALASINKLTTDEVSELTKASYSAHLEASRQVGQQSTRLEWLPYESQTHSTRWGGGKLATGAIAAVELVGDRFRQNLIRAGLPQARIMVSSTHRTPNHHARLRVGNSNAAKGVSSHEFGGSFDITYRRFAAPEMGDDPLAYQLKDGLPLSLSNELARDLAYQEHQWQSQLIRRHAEAYAAVLGRTLIELQQEKKIIVLREVDQPCFHITAMPN